MREYICKEVQAENWGYIEIETELIRCKECKYYQQGGNADEWLWCMMNHHYTDEEKYCAWAEPKGEQ